MGKRKKRKIIVRNFLKLICDLLVPYLSLSHVVRSQAYMRSSTRITKKFSHITAQKKVFFSLKQDFFLGSQSCCFERKRTQ